jgi:hypothetical protein
LKHLKTFEEIPTLERGVLEGLYQIVKTLRLFHIERANGMVEKGRFPSFFHRLNTLWGRLIVAEINRLKKRSQEKTTPLCNVSAESIPTKSGRLPRRASGPEGRYQKKGITP